MDNFLLNAKLKQPILKWLILLILPITCSLLLFFAVEDSDKFPFIIVPLLIGILPLSFIILYKELSFLCLLLTLFFYFRPHELVSVLGSLRVPLLLIIATFSSFIINVYFKRIKFYWSIEDKFIIIICSLLTLGVIFATNTQEWILWEITMVNCLLTIVIGSSLNKRQDFIYFQRFILMSGILLLYFSLVKSYMAGGIMERLSFADDGSLHSADTNTLAMLLEFSLGAYTVLLFQKNENKYKKLFSIIIIPVLLYAIFLTRSRGGILSLFTLYFVIGFYKSKSKKLFSLLYLTTAILIGIIVFGIIHQERSDLLIGQGVGEDESSQSRMFTWLSGLLIGLHHPLLGAGLGNFSDLSHQYLNDKNYGIKVVHNLWMGLFSEGGFLVLILHLILVIKGFTSLHQCLKILNQSTPRDEQMFMVVLSITAVYASYFVYAFFMPTYFWSDVYIFLGLSLALKRLIVIPNSKI